MMRTVLAASVTLVLGGCGVKYGQQNGWITFEMPGVPPSLQYRLPQGGTFVAMCNPDQTVGFSLLGAGNPANTETFIVTTGKWTHAFETYGAQQKAGLVMLPSGDSGSAEEAADGRAIEAALGQTTAPIVFRAMNWSRAIPASPEIGKFVATCHAAAKSGH